MEQLRTCVAGSMASIKGRFGPLCGPVFLLELYMPHFPLRIKCVVA